MSLGKRGALGGSFRQPPVPSRSRPPVDGQDSKPYRTLVFLAGSVQVESKLTTPGRAREFLGLICFLFLTVTLVSLYVNLQGLDAEHAHLAAEIGRSYFQAIETMRHWNLDHGGIYMRVAPDTLPDPRLPASLREVQTTGRLRLAMINHAHMTRLFSDLLSHQKGVHLHITSLRPLRPANKPDAWEQQALEQFEQGRSEEYAVLTDEGESVFRYMAPLRTEPACLSCHSGREEAAHTVQGGISVSFSYAPFLEAVAQGRNRVIFAHAMFFVLGLGLVTLTGRKLIQSVDALQDSLRHIKRLEGILPICANCKKIRLEGAASGRQDSWVSVEHYIERRTDALFSHSLCPQCIARLYPELADQQLSLDGAVDSAARDSQDGAPGTPDDSTGARPGAGG